MLNIRTFFSKSKSKALKSVASQFSSPLTYKFSTVHRRSKKVKDIPDLQTFLKSSGSKKVNADGVLMQDTITHSLNEMKYHIETYGCQMNSADSEIVASILEGAGMEYSSDINQANLIMLNTCAIRENAESKIWNRLNYLNSNKARREFNLSENKGKRIVGVLGCMAERLKEKLVEKSKVVDMVVGPDAYRDIPGLVSNILVSLNIL